MNRLISITLACLLQAALAVASSFNLLVEVTPNGAGSLNTSGGTYEEGSTVYLRTYSHTGYVFKGWYSGENLLSSSSGFDYTMPSADVVVQARYEYDPTVPANPEMADTTTYYSFTADVSPAGAGSLNTTSGRYAVGASVYLRAYSNTGFRFVGWFDKAGETLSSSASFNYTMPAHDAQLTAQYVYDPDVPANPDSMATRYTVTVACKPAGSGSFNVTSATSEEGKEVRLYAYCNTGYEFLRWENEAGETISTDQSFYYVMPHGNSKVYGIYEYNPANPGNPGRNYWNKDFGEVIVDDFTPGRLNDAVSAVINGSSRNDVAMITVAGRMNDYDFGIANEFSSCTLLDLSRVTGITEIPSYAFDYSNLESVYLPASTEIIGYRAFFECKQLSLLTVYAMVPPALGESVFTGVPEGLVVYVPASAISLYQDADGWKDFTILPIQNDVRSLTVSLPDGVDVGDFAQLWLELTNTKNGQHMHYVTTDRTEYTFANIIRNTSWNVVLRNERGDVFGSINNVEVADEDVSVTFASLSRPQHVTLAVTADGRDVTEEVQVTWTDADGNYVAQDTSLAGLPVGYLLGYSIVLPQELAMAYSTPAATTYTLADGANSLVCQLQPISRVHLSGQVKEASTGLPLGGAVVSVSQTFSGKYGKTLSTKTDGNGSFAIDVHQVPTTVAYSAADYVSQTMVCDELVTGSTDAVVLPDVQLKSITGAVITMSFTYTTVEGDTQSWYSDYQNVDYTVTNTTKGRAVNQYNVQYPQIVLLEPVDDGDVLTLTATSRTNAFLPVQCTAVIDGQKASALFAITELGRIEATFTKTGNAVVVGSLYDATGKLLRTSDYTEAQLTFGNLTDGLYTLVTMGSSRLFNTIYDLAQLPQTGLAEGTDYVVNTVEVKSGATSRVNIAEVPTLDESKLYYTGSNTSFTVNKPSIVAGNYLTLTGRIDFKPAYATSVSDVEMIIDLPESCQFVENSVMVGNSTSSYTLNGHQLTINMARYTDRVRFCVIPTLGGNYAPSAFVRFSMDGQTVTQPIGSASFTAKDLSISVPSTVAKTSVPISGTAIGASSVEIFDNGVLIGQTTSLANGLWSTTCELNDPYNLSTHSISAKVTTKTGLELQSETMECLYDMNAIQVSKVIMYHDNPEQHKTYEVVFDFMSPSQQPSTYVYYIYNKEFTFTIDFTNNDPEKVSNVVLYVKTGNDGKWTPLKPTYDEKKDLWIASGQFGNMYDGNIPVNVKVSYDVNSEPVLDARLFDDVMNLKEAFQQVLDNEDKVLADVIARYNAAVAADNEEQADALLEELSNLLGLGEVPDTYSPMSDEERSQLEALVQQDAGQLLTTLNNIPLQSIYQKDAVSQYLEGITIDHAPDLTPEQLIAQGYEAVKKTDGSVYYVLLGEDAIHYVDFTADIYMVMTGDVVQASRRASDNSGQVWLDRIQNLCEKVESWCSEILGVFDDCVERIAKSIANNEKLLDEARSQLANKKKLNLSKDEVKKLRASISEYSENIKNSKHLKKLLNEEVRPYIGSGKTKFSKVAGKSFTLFALATDAWEGYQNEKKLVDLHKSIKAPCPEAESAAESLKSDVNGWIWKAGVYYVAKVGADVAELFNFSVGVGGLIPSGGTSVTAILAAAAVMAANIAAGMLFDWRYKVNYQRFCEEYRELYKLCKKEPCDGVKPCPPGSDPEDKDNDKKAQESGCPDSNPQIDPSGYVYEGVFSNRVEGAIATVFYKEEVEDMYGDIHENIVKWDAEEYAQQNPLFTDENGYYRWDVPNGLWQVKFEKEGYETTYSEWLPVPPPQLDINIAMKQNVQPNVRQARAFEDAVEVEFDKYMTPELLTAENILVMKGDQPVEGTVSLLNEEYSYEGSDVTFASKVRFNAAEPFDAQEVTLFVSNRVESYAGVRMQDDYSQTFTVEQEVRRIVSDSLAKVLYGQQATIAVSVLPASAAAGKTLTVHSSSPMVLTAEVASVVLDENGRATITVSGELPGTAAVVFKVEGSEATSTTIVNVERLSDIITPMPTASIASGSEVEQGAAVTLSCATEGVTIYYTVDGSCPCDASGSRKVYDGTPIIVGQTVTIKAIAVAADGTESDVAEFTYIVKDDSGIADITVDSPVQISPLPVHDRVTITASGQAIRRVTLTSLSGALIAVAGGETKLVTFDVSHVAAGIYIVQVVTGGGTYSHKIQKIQ